MPDPSTPAIEAAVERAAIAVGRIIAPRFVDEPRYSREQIARAALTAAGFDSLLAENERLKELCREMLRAANRDPDDGPTGWPQAMSKIAEIVFPLATPRRAYE